MRISNEMISLFKKVVFIALSIVIIVSLLELVFIGKNLTFTTKFTPLESQQNQLRNQSYITEAQVLIILLCVVYTILVPSVTYSSFKQSQKAFFTIMLATIIVNGLLIFLNFYFLIGGKTYRNYMNRQRSDFQSKLICQNERISLCMIGKCVRLSVFQQARSMAIAFIVINGFISIVFTVFCILINRKRKDPQKMELIV